jgi:hypothetical protein
MNNFIFLFILSIIFINTASIHAMPLKLPQISATEHKTTSQPGTVASSPTIPRNNQIPSADSSRSSIFPPVDIVEGLTNTLGESLIKRSESEIASTAGNMATAVMNIGATPVAADRESLGETIAAASFQSSPLLTNSATKVSTGINTDASITGVPGLLAASPIKAPIDWGRLLKKQGIIGLCTIFALYFFSDYIESINAALLPVARTTALLLGRSSLKYGIDNLPKDAKYTIPAETFLTLLTNYIRLDLPFSASTNNKPSIKPALDPWEKRQKLEGNFKEFSEELELLIKQCQLSYWFCEEELLEMANLLYNFIDLVREIYPEHTSKNYKTSNFFEQQNLKSRIHRHVISHIKNKLTVLVDNQQKEKAKYFQLVLSQLGIRVELTESTAQTYAASEKPDV